jgi:hypothetical protein
MPAGTAAAPAQCPGPSGPPAAGQPPLCRQQVACSPLLPLSPALPPAANPAGSTAHGMRACLPAAQPATATSVQIGPGAASACRLGARAASYPSRLWSQQVLHYHHQRQRRRHWRRGRGGGGTLRQSGGSSSGRSGSSSLLAGPAVQGLGLGLRSCWTCSLGSPPAQLHRGGVHMARHAARRQQGHGRPDLGRHLTGSSGESILVISALDINRRDDMQPHRQRPDAGRPGAGVPLGRSSIWMAGRWAVRARALDVASAAAERTARP